MKEIDLCKGCIMDKIKLRCPACQKGYKLTTKKDGTTRCHLCGFEGKREVFEIKEA